MVMASKRIIEALPACWLQVMQAVGSCMTNKYSEGLPGARYYGGNEHIDKMERLCQVYLAHMLCHTWFVQFCELCIAKVVYIML